MKQYDKEILNKLLDRYENSLLSVGENKRQIQIEVRFTRTSIPRYFDESSNDFEYIHIQMKALEEAGLLTILWKDGKRDYLISKVRLNPDHIKEAYAYVHRLPKRSLEEENILLLEKYVDTAAPITSSFAKYLIGRLSKHQSVKEYIALEDHAETEKFLRACQMVERNEAPCYLREFSIRHFADSKYFEQVEHRVAKVLRRFSDSDEHLQREEGSEDYAQMDTAELLAEFGIYRTPNYVYLKGDATISIGGNMVNLSSMKQGMGISGEDLPGIGFVDVSSLERVMTVENLTSFFRCQEENTLYIYLGGYHNHIRRQLLKAVHEILPHVAYYHFGDIDAGGFCILKDLRRKTGIPFTAYCMDLETLRKYRTYAKPLTEMDRRRLEKLAAEEEFREAIGFMLAENVKLEQECVREGKEA